MIERAVFPADKAVRAPLPLEMRVAKAVCRKIISLQNFLENPTSICMSHRASNPTRICCLQATAVIFRIIAVALLTSPGLLFPFLFLPLPSHSLSYPLLLCYRFRNGPSVVGTGVKARKATQRSSSPGKTSPISLPFSSCSGSITPTSAPTEPPAVYYRS